MDQWTGVPIRSAQRFQFNFRLTNFRDPENLDRIDNLPDDLMVPVMWMDKVNVAILPHICVLIVVIDS